MRPSCKMRNVDVVGVLPRSVLPSSCDLCLELDTSCALDPKHWRYQLYFWDGELKVGVAPRIKVIKTNIYGIDQ